MTRAAAVAVNRMEYLELVLVRESLDNIPQHPLPPGYRMRTYRRGDRRTWVSIERASEPFGRITRKTFDASFGEDLGAMPRRCLFLLAAGGEEVGTITAWYDRNYRGRRWGRIHWVAIIPAHRGRGLSKCMMTVAMDRLRALGHRRVVLGTHTPRIAAIKTYLDFGFQPEITTPEAERAWRLVRRHLRR